MGQAVVEAHVDADLAQKAEAIFTAAGMTVEDAVRRLLLRTVHDEAVPFELFVANAETMESIEDARAGRFAGEGSMTDLFREIDAEG